MIKNTENGVRRRPLEAAIVAQTLREREVPWAVIQSGAKAAKAQGLVISQPEYWWAIRDYAWENYANV